MYLIKGSCIFINVDTFALLHFPFYTKIVIPFLVRPSSSGIKHFYTAVAGYSCSTSFALLSSPVPSVDSLILPVRIKQCNFPKVPRGQKCEGSFFLTQCILNAQSTFNL